MVVHRRPGKRTAQSTAASSETARAAADAAQAAADVARAASAAAELAAIAAAAAARGQRAAQGAQDAVDEEFNFYEQNLKQIEEGQAEMTDQIEDLKKKLSETTGAAVRQINNNECMTKANYAKHLKALLGKNDLEGQDVFRIIAEFKGGANHPDNCLFALGSSFNRSIGNRFDHLNAFLAGKQKTQKAVQASMDFGSYDLLKNGGSSSNAKDEAERLFGKGQKLMTAVHAKERTSQ